MTDEYGGKLQFRIWVTRGCFFVLSDRLKRKGQFSIGATTLLSVYVLSISLVALVFGSRLPLEDITAISLISVILSVLIIVITLLENSKDYSREAELAFQTAHKLENLYGRYEAFLAGRIEGAELSFRDEYSAILRDARTTRKSIDYHQFQLQNLAEFKKSWFSAVLIALSFVVETLAEYWLYLAMTIPPLIAIVWFVTKVGMRLV